MGDSVETCTLVNKSKNNAPDEFTPQTIDYADSLVPTGGYFIQHPPLETSNLIILCSLCSFFLTFYYLISCQNGPR